MPADEQRALLETDSYDYELPSELVASVPCDDRAQSRLLVVSDAGMKDRSFSDITDVLMPGDLLVRNTARVLPARLFGQKLDTRGKVELLVLAPVSGGWSTPGPSQFEAMGRSSKGLRPGTLIELDSGHRVSVDERLDNGILRLTSSGPESLEALLESTGMMPIPPYILRARRSREQDTAQDIDRIRYQTVYAGRPGAVAAPTAGLHFDEQLFGRIADLGVEVADVHLDVGAGTFKPISCETITDHKMHNERYQIERDAAEAINAALSEGRRIVALGTTSMRVLEDQAQRGTTAQVGRFATDIFIRPGVPVRWVSGLITNFHLPRSSLLTLVCAFAGYNQVMGAYSHAVRHGYRFYSYGDAMFLTRSEMCPI